MMGKLLLLEFYKLRRRKAWLIPLLFLLALFFWSSYALSRYTDKGGTASWEYLLYQFGTLNSLLFTIVITIITSRLCDLEHKGQAMRLIGTIVKPAKIYWAKFLCAGIILLLTIAGEFIVMIAISKILNFETQLPYDNHFYFFIGTFATALCIQLFVQTLALILKNQLVPLICGISAGFVGFMSLLFPQGIHRLCFWAYFIDFAGIAMDYNAATREMSFRYLPFPWICLIVVIAAGTIAYLVGLNLFRKKEW